jgi:serine/threonine protein kinase
MAEVPARIGPYEVLSRLGTGGMAETYVAVRRGPGAFVQRVCLKRIRTGLEHDPEFVRQFMAEAAIAARLRHATIAQVLDFGREGDDYYLALELVEGLDLRELLEVAGGRLSPELALYVATELATALDFAHRGGGAPGEAAVVHRDVSPSNTLVSIEGEVKLTDFGIARAVGGPQHTRTGIVKGKVAYLAPEYARSGRFDPRCDLFALGVLLYECLTGERPHDGATELETLERAARGERVPLRQRAPDLSERLEEIVERLLEPDPELRFESASALLEALLALPAPQRARRELGALVASLVRDRSAANAAALAPAPDPTAIESQDGPIATAARATRTHAARAPSSSSGESVVLPIRRWGARLTLGAALSLALAVALLTLQRAPQRTPAASERSAPAARPRPAAASSPKPESVNEAPRARSTDGRARAPSEQAPIVNLPTPEPPPEAAKPRARSARPAVLEIVVLPYGEVSLDGRRIGSSPITLSLPPGEHAISARSRDNLLERRVSLTAGEHRKLVLR